MSASLIRSRTAQIVLRFNASRDLILDGDGSIVSLEQTTRFEGLAEDTMRMLRENKTNCVREEQAMYRRGGAGPDQGVIDLGYSEAKAEIDDLVNSITGWKRELRAAKQHWMANDGGPDRSDKLRQLAVMHRSGVLTSSEFSAAMSRLLIDGETADDV